MITRTAGFTPDKAVLACVWAKITDRMRSGRHHHPKASRRYQYAPSSPFHKIPQCMSGLVAVVRDHYHQSGRYLAIKLLAREPHADQRQFEFQNVRPADGTTLPSIGGTAAGPAGGVLLYSALREAGSGTFETCPPILRMSVHRARPDVAVVRPNRREWTLNGHLRLE
jgi:hypothetical protein